MSPLAARLHHLANLLVGGTGVVYAWMLYGMTSEDEFSIWNHPWQGMVHDSHLVVAPILVISFGVVWQEHAYRRLQNGQRTRRSSGIALGLSFLPMLFSAYLLQTAIDEDWRSTWKWVHLVTSALWILAYVGHQLRPRKTTA